MTAVIIKFPSPSSIPFRVRDQYRREGTTHPPQGLTQDDFVTWMRAADSIDQEEMRSV